LETFFSYRTLILETFFSYETLIPESAKTVKGYFLYFKKYRVQEEKCRKCKGARRNGLIVLIGRRHYRLIVLTF